MKKTNLKRNYDALVQEIMDLGEKKQKIMVNEVKFMTEFELDIEK